MSQKVVKTVRRTVVVIVDDTVPITTRILDWESRARTGYRRVHRVEWAEPSIDELEKTGAVLIDMEITCKGANRHDFTKFVRAYLPEAHHHYITE